MVPGIRVRGWEGDLVSRDVGLSLQTKIILLHNTQKKEIKHFLYDIRMKKNPPVLFKIMRLLFFNDT